MDTDAAKKLEELREQVVGEGIVAITGVGTLHEECGDRSVVAATSRMRGRDKHPAPLKAGHRPSGSMLDHDEPVVPGQGGGGRAAA
ncbi:hypothetical protein ACIP5Y_42515 [Nocardia sp. NPDC088792]|uniref:hypothetical protein n=1 Tax=Nocardia sp. NPDC088792 TaxID=3364332 RepID=UPI0038021295